MSAGQWDILADALPRFIIPGLDYTTAFSLYRSLSAVSSQLPPANPGPRVAVLGSFTTHQFVNLLELYLAAGGVRPAFYEAEYGTFRQEILDPASELYRFRPTS